VSGNLGDAALALAHLQKRCFNEAEFAACAPALHQPSHVLRWGQVCEVLPAV